MSYGHAIRGSKHGPCPEFADSPVFKSAWERNVYRVFRNLRYEIQYESERFRFPEPYRRSIDYCPDFFIRKGTEERLVEVKGWLDGPSKTRLMGFRKFYPERVKQLLVVTRDRGNVEWVRTHLPGAELWDYPVIHRQLGFLVAWEG
jgi:hypothetical protein